MTSTLCTHQGKVAPVQWPQKSCKMYILSRVFPQQVTPRSHASTTPLRPSVQSPVPPSTFLLPWNPPKHLPYKSSFTTKISHLTLTLQSAPRLYRLLYIYQHPLEPLFKEWSKIQTTPCNSQVHLHNKLPSTNWDPWQTLSVDSDPSCSTMPNCFSVQELQSKLAQSFEILLIQKKLCSTKL